MSQDNIKQSPPIAESDNQPPAPRMIIGVGASAGGLDAFTQLLKVLPGNTGAAFVVIQHLSPTHKSIMVDLLQKHTAMPVQEAEDGVTVAGNHIYVIPPGSIMSIHQNRLCLARTSVSHRGRQRPIDEFFISLAHDAAERAAGVILSGMGSDGTAGIKAIKEAGGLVMVEDPARARYSGMPKSVAATGLADFVLPIPELARKLVDFARQPHLVRRARERSIYGLGEKALRHIIETLHSRTGYDFREYKKPTLSRRIQRRMGLRNITDPAVYAELLNKNDQESALLFKDMLIGVTAFFRDYDAFTEIGKQVMAPLVRQHGGKTPVRVWIPGCTTGEEAYSVAILLYEEFVRQGVNFNAQIFATDIDEDAVTRARLGHYSANVANEIPEQYLHRYFYEEDGGYVVKKTLRESVTFAVQNLINDPPFSKLDLICCRNVLIYLETAMQHRLLNLFHFALNDNGYLFLGSSESTTRHEGYFKPVSKQNRIFQKNANALRNNHHELNEHRVQSFAKSRQMPKGTPISPFDNQSFSAAETAREALLSHYAPPAVLINGDYEVQYFQGETSRFLNLPEGEPTNDLCAIAIKGLKTKIRAAVQKAKKTGISAYVHARNIVQRGGGTCSATVAAYPVRKNNTDETLYLVTFNESDEDEKAKPGDQLIDEKEAELSSQLEYELYATRQDLQSTIEQLETSNEELKASNEEIMSMNEELQSSNEELETSREELQSLNEELNTVNYQLEEKVTELETVNNDLSNLLASTDIATIFLDLDLRIRRFTSATHNIIHLIDSDVGRPLADLALNIRDEDLIDDAREALQSLQPLEKQISDGNGNHYLRRITLYRTRTRRIEGVVVTFTDVTEITSAMKRLASREKQQALVARFGQEALAERDLDVLFDKAAQWSTEAIGVEYCKLLQRRDDGLLLRAGVGWAPGLVGQATLPSNRNSQGGFTLASRTPIIVEDLNQEIRFEGAQLLVDHEVTSGMSVIIGPIDNPWGVLGVHTRSYRRFTPEDINFIQAMANGLWAAIQHRRQETALRNRQEWLRLALTSAQLTSSWIDLENGKISQYSPTNDDRGIEEGNSIPLPRYLEWVHPEDRDKVKHTWERTVDNRGSFVMEYRIVSSGEDGEHDLRWLRAWGQYVDLPGRDRLAGLTMDVTEEKDNEVRLQAAKAAADASNQAKSAFLANMSHEIRTPLTAILGYTDLLHLELSGESPAESHLRRIKTNGHSLLEIINDVLDLSKVEANRIEISEQQFALKSLLAELLSLMHLRANEKKLDFKVETAGDVPDRVSTDPGRLKQILVNLLSNAIKFTRHGSVRLVVSAAPLETPANTDDADADVPPGAKDTLLTFEVIDTGIGIEPRVLHRIFDPFEQADLSVARTYGGTGLGLTISKRIATLLGGRLAAESEVDKGSTFSLTLPVGTPVDAERTTIDHVDEIVSEPSVAHVDTKQLRGVHVLVVDDIEDILILIEQMLVKTGARVTLANNGLDAIERIEECQNNDQPVDVVLMDTMMPVMDGYSAVSQLRNKGFARPIVALTAAAMSNDRDRCLAAGCDDYLSKPVSLEKLLDVLHTHLPKTRVPADAPLSFGEGARVLIVEDNRDAGEAIQTLLSLHGYESRLAVNGGDGIAEAKRFHPDVVLMDLTLPDMDGYAVAELLQEQAGTGIRLLAISGHDLQQQWQRLRAAGFHGYLQKPVGREALTRYFPALAQVDA